MLMSSYYEKDYSPMGAPDVSLMGPIIPELGLGTFEELPSGLKTAWAIAATLSVGACAYHGYRRNQSVGWAIGWAAAGAFFPVISVGVALAQGFGERK